MIKCDYCGRENQDETAPCPGCGTPPAGTPDEVEVEASRSGSTSGLLDCAIGVTAIAAGHVGGFIHVIKGLTKLDFRAGENSPHRLLETAAALESVDMRQAVALYKQIALDHPGTPAAEEANRNIHNLRATNPELGDSPARPEMMIGPEEWPFDQAPNVAAITTRQVITDGLPILSVVHYRDDELLGIPLRTTDKTEDCRVIGMGTALKLDPTLRAIADILPGWAAYRKAVGAAWHRYENEKT